MTREERLRSEDMGNYFRVAADSRDLNYDKFVVKGQVHTMQMNLTPATTLHVLMLQVP